jgi:hypothetical protein
LSESKRPRRRRALGDLLAARLGIEHTPVDPPKPV